MATNRYTREALDDMTPKQLDAVVAKVVMERRSKVACRYSTTGGGMLEVIERLLSLPASYRLTNGNRYPHIAEITTNNNVYLAFSDSLPRAVCIAAVLAVQAMRDEEAPR